MQSTQPATTVSLLIQEEVKEEFITKDKKIRNVFSMNTNEELKKYEIISKNTPSLYKWDCVWWRLEIKIIIMSCKIFIFMAFFDSWSDLDSIDDNIPNDTIASIVLSFMLIGFYGSPFLMLMIYLESIWRTRYHYGYLSHGVIVKLEGRSWYKRKVFWLYCTLCLTLFVTGLISNLGENNLDNWSKLKKSTFAAASTFIGLMMTVKSILSSEENSMCKLHEFIRNCGSKKEADEIFNELLAVNEKDFILYILNRKSKMKELTKNIGCCSRRGFLKKNWCFNKNDLALFMKEQSGSSFTGCCGWRKMFWGIPVHAYI